MKNVATDGPITPIVSDVQAFFTALIAGDRLSARLAEHLFRTPPRYPRSVA